MIYNQRTSGNALSISWRNPSHGKLKNNRLSLKIKEIVSHYDVDRSCHQSRIILAGYCPVARPMS